MNKIVLFFLLFNFCFIGGYSGISITNGFIENKGQVVDQYNQQNPAVKYLYNSPGLKVQLRKDGFSYDIYSVRYYDKKLKFPPSHDTLNYKDSSLISFHRIDFSFINANPDYLIETSSPSPGYVNYYTTGCGINGAQNVRHYQTIVFKDLYQNIDLYFTDDPATGFKYNYVIRPGGDINQIKFRIDGAPAKLNGSKGSIIIKTRFGNLSEEIPLSYIDNPSGKKPIKVCFRKFDLTIFGLSLKEDLSSVFPLIIDPIPTRKWGTYFGGSFIESVSSRNSDIDNQQNLIVGGVTNSSNNIATIGAFLTTIQGGFDAFIAKFTPSGSLIWATYFGGPAWEGVSSVGTDHDNNIYLGGNTLSSSNIATPGAYQTFLSGAQDAYIAKFNAGGQRIWSTYFGGIEGEIGANCCVGPTGSLYLSGYTSSTTNIATPGACQTIYGGGSSDCYLVKFSSSGNRLWGTYYGGGLLESGASCTVDSSDNVYLCGETFSFNNIATPGAFKPALSGTKDGFLVAFDSTGIRQWGTYYGGEEADVLTDICTDSIGNCYFLGYTFSTTGIATPGAYQSSLIIGSSLCIGEFNSTGQRIWGSYYGAEAPAGSNCSLSQDSSAFYISGSSTNVPSVSLLVSSDAYQSQYGGGSYDGFFAKFTTNGQRVWGSLYGGSDIDRDLNIIPDNSNNFYLIGNTQSPDNIATQNALNPILQGLLDVFIVKFADCYSPDTANMIFGPVTVCEYTDSLLFHIDSIPQATSYFWTVSPGLAIISGQGSDSIFINTSSGGTVETITIKGVNDCGEGNEKIHHIPVNIRPHNISLSGTDSICSGVPVLFTTDAGKSNYEWNWSAGGILISGGTATDSIATISWNVSGTQWIRVNYSDTNGCSALIPVQHQIIVTADSIVDVNIQVSDNNICSGTSVIFTTNPTNPGSLPYYDWKVNGIAVGTNSPTFSYTPLNGDQVSCILTSSNTVCTSNNPATSNTIMMVVNPIQPVSVTVSPFSNPVCAGAQVSCTAVPVNGGITPQYQWKVNGLIVGTNSPGYSYVPVNSDAITCTLTSNVLCPSGNPAISNTVTMLVNPILPVGVSIVASSNPFCSGSLVTFTASAVNGGSNPAFQWKVNGINAGTNNPVFAFSPVNGDVITCSLSSSETCTSGNPAQSNTLTMTVNENLLAGITIAVSSNPFCPGSAVTFTAIPLNGGSTPSYQWKVNGINTGTNSSTFIYTPLNNDSIRCIMTSNMSCVTGNPVSSAKIIMSGTLAPIVSFTSCFDTVTTLGAKAFKLKGGIPLGGSYSGPGVNSLTGVFTPSSASIGLKTISYTYTNVSSCSANKTKTILVQANPAFTCGNNFTDIRDGKLYATVLIGTQCWMTSNLNYGSPVPSSQVQYDNCISEKYSYNDVVGNCTKYGGLYQWDEVMKYDDTPAGQGLCPPGWHVPTESEWTTLFNFYQGNALAGKPLQDTILSGFKAQTSGVFYLNSSWSFNGFATLFWSSTTWSAVKAISHGINIYDFSVSLYPSSKANAFPIRCLHD